MIASAVAKISDFKDLDSAKQYALTKAKKALGIVKGEIYTQFSENDEFVLAIASVQDVPPPVLPGTEITDRMCELKRNRFTNKGSYGRVYVIGGSDRYIGAPLLSAQAAVSAGAGLTTLCVPCGLADSYRRRIKEITLLTFSGETCIKADLPRLEEISQKADAIVVGPGMGDKADADKILSYLFDRFCGRLIVDADGINALAKEQSLLNIKRKCDLILTPHVKEFERLAANEEPQEFAKKFGLCVAVKNAYTLVTDGTVSYKVVSGCAAMAKGGSGDVLSGIVAAYSCRTSPLEALAIACHTFGRCGERAAADKGENAVKASDIIEYLR